MEPSAESDSEKLAESDLSDEEYVPDDGECMNDANSETDEPAEGSGSDRETDILILIPRNPTPRNLLHINTDGKKNEHLCMMTHLKASFRKHRQKQMDSLLCIITTVFGTITSANTLPTKSISIVCTKPERQLQLLQLKLRGSLESK